MDFVASYIHYAIVVAGSRSDAIPSFNVDAVLPEVASFQSSKAPPNRNPADAKCSPKLPTLPTLDVA